MNKKLVEEPSLLTQEPHGKGYIGIVLPRLMKFDLVKHNLLSKEEYNHVYKENADELGGIVKSKQ